MRNSDTCLPFWYFVPRWSLASTRQTVIQDILLAVFMNITMLVLRDSSFFELLFDCWFFTSRRKHFSVINVWFCCEILQMFREKKIRIIRKLSYWLEKETCFLSKHSECLGFYNFQNISTIVCLVCVLFSALTQTLLPSRLSPPGKWLIVQSWLTVFEITSCTKKHLCLLKLS